MYNACLYTCNNTKYINIEKMYDKDLLG